MDQVRLEPPPPVDIERVAREQGVAVDYVGRPSGFHGQVIAGRAVIEVARADPPHRRRFTIGHELGHYILEHNPVSSAANEWELGDPRQANEREADIFAAELLMPEEWVREDWKELRNARQMAARYFVSEEAMWYRLEELRLIAV
jgi:Zn-dependent peptidase ImmA (M78 family)